MGNWILFILITSLKITFIHVLFWEGMLLFKVGRKIKSTLTTFLKKKREKWTTYLSFSPLSHPKVREIVYSDARLLLITKPLFECLTCMTSVWGLIFWFAGGGSVCWLLLQYLLILGGINAIIDCMITQKKISDELQ